jgi:hypothetical protein
MKRLLRLSMCLIMLIVVASLSSCDHLNGYKHAKENLDSMQVMQWLMEFDDPSFVDAEDVLSYQHGEKQRLTQDSIFYSIPQTALLNVVSVLQKQGVKLSKTTIVDEFTSNKKVYLNLPEPEQVKETKEMSAEIESIPNIAVKDTVINGQAMKVVTSNTIK